MRFLDLTSDQAQAFCALFAQQEEARINELVSWAQRTSGPAEDLDASVTSLEPLWDWFVAFLDRGAPGVPPDAAPSWYSEEFLGHPLPDATPEQLRAQYASQAIAHYLHLVAVRLDPTAHWAVLYADNADRHEPGIRFQGDRWLMARLFLANTSSAATTLGRPARSPDRLRRLFLLEAPPHAATAPMAGPSLVTDPEARRALLAAAATAQANALPTVPPPPREAPIHEAEGLVVYDGPAEGLDDRPQALRALDAGILEQMLIRFGFTRLDGALVEHLDLSSEGEELFHPEGAACVITLVHRGKLRSFALESLTPSSQQWYDLTTATTEAARTLRARVCTDDEIE